MNNVNEITTAPVTTHGHAHLDEVAVFFVMVTLGRVKKENGLTCLFNPNSKEHPSSQAIGIGRGDLDEHTSGKNGRDEDSAFSKAVKQFGLEQDVRIKNLQRFINRTDSGGGKHPYDLSTVVQAIHRCHPGSSEDGVEWCLKILEAVWNDPKYFDHTVEACGKFFEQAGSAWLLNRFGKINAKSIYSQILKADLENFEVTMKKVGEEKNPPLIKVSQFFREGCKGMSDTFALPRVIYSAYKHFGMQTAFKLAGIALNAKYEGQMNFQKALIEVQNAGTKKFGRFTALYIETTNLETQRAVLFSRKDVAVTIQRNTYSKHTQIFSNSKTGVSLKKLAATIRLEELELAELPTDDLSEEELCGAGNACGLENWCYIVRHQDDKGNWKGSEMLLNGSESHVGVAPTRIHKERIKQLVANCLISQ